MSDKVYITTTLPYVNADPHIGHALEFIQADVYARYQRLLGNEVFFNTGTDEHGQKVFQKAEEEKRDINEYVNSYANEFKKLKELLGLSYDAFIRTTDEGHIKAAQELWRRCDIKGDIYKKKYQGLYCVGDEMFLREGDLVDGKCPNHPNLTPIEIEEENYFFKLSNYKDKLIEYLNKKDSVVPDWRREEAIKFIEAGLEDLSISRDQSRLSWGVSVPKDDSQVMYVWFDALSSYISTLGWPDDSDGNFKKFWQEGEVLQLAGKDQIRFQSIIWQAMLMSAEIKLTDKVIYHGFITSGGKKMSKSLGNVISPLEMVEKFGTEATRYLLIRHTHPFDDTDITWERMNEWYTANLVNGLGNLVSRIMKMAEDNKIVFAGHNNLYSENISKSLKAWEFSETLNLIWTDIQNLDQRITKEEPFKLIKTDPNKAKQIISELVGELNDIAFNLEPIMPETSAKIKQAIKANKKPESLFVRK